MTARQGPFLPRGAVLFSDGAISYEFIERLGRGPHGESLLLARRRTPQGLGREVILKCVVLPEGPPTAAALKSRARLEEEVRLASYLHHPRISRSHGPHRVQDAVYALVECIEGASLCNLLSVDPERVHRFSDAFILHLGAQVAGALAYAHTRTDEAGRPLGIVHRAVDLERIYVTWGGHIQLTDFGLAFSLLAGRRPSTEQRPRGNVYYCSPELLLGGPVDARSDLFSLGTVLLEMAAGVNLFDPPRGMPERSDGNLSPRERRRMLRAIRTAKRVGFDASVEGVIRRAATFTSEDIAEATQGLPESLRSPIRRLLQREPAERYPDATRLEADLASRLEAQGPRGPQETRNEIEKALLESGKRLAEFDSGLSWPNSSRSEGGAI
uniref:non-specific serine/threonine protein kinase n=1 Tax=Stigmatella aurantiaca Sg a15 TaxID=675526 RepID=A0A3Q8I141_STIAU|nr:serine/threonine protein kinase [Stigmatella aurantiaca Sg a15]